MSRIFGALAALLLLLYPLLVYLGLQSVQPRVFGGALLVLLALRFWSRGQETESRSTQDKVVLVFGGLVAIAILIAGRAELLRVYPVLINFSLLSIFAISLKQGPPIIERFARIQHPDLTPRGVMHTRQATYAWSFFFFLNGTAALYTGVFSDWKQWTVFNGFWSYIGMGVLFVAEWVVRRYRMAQDERQKSQQT